MSLSEKNKKLIIIVSSLVSLFVALLLIAQLIIGNILENKLKTALSKNNDNNYIVSFGQVKVNLFTMTLIFKGVAVVPDSALISSLKIRHPHVKSAYKIEIPIVRIRNIGVINYLMNKKIGVDDFILKNASICMYSTNADISDKQEPDTDLSKSFKMDSIAIPGIAGISINNILITNFRLDIIRLENNDTTFSAKNLDLVFRNIDLVKANPDNEILKLAVKDIKVKMSDEKLNLPGGKYTLSFDNMSFNMEQALLVIENFKITPRYSLERMAKLSKYQYEIYTCDIKSLEVHSIRPLKILMSYNIILSNIIIDNMNLSIYKDKHFPFDITKRPKIPTQSLKTLKENLYIDSVIIKNSVLTYSELHKLMDEPMIVNLTKLNATVANITSISDSIAHRPVLSVKILANLQKRIPMGVNLYLPMNSVADTFSFNGWLGNGNMKLFNKILLPAIGIKFDAGTLDGLKFTARANPTYSIGEITMLYHDLDGVVVRKDMEQTNKFLSWVANTAMIKNNPIPSKENRIEPMFFERVMYKGLGNFIWKTLQSGITATLIPTIDKKVQKQIDTKLGTDKKTIRKRERKSKRKKH